MRVFLPRSFADLPHFNKLQSKTGKRDKTEPGFAFLTVIG